MITMQEKTGVKPSEYVKAFGIKRGIKQLSEMTGVSQQVLIRWYDNKPQLLKVLCQGAQIELKNHHG